jgi:phosphoserine phosphatase RsbU/P
MLACARYDIRITAAVSASALALCELVGYATGQGTTPFQRDRLLVVLLTGCLAMLVAIVRGRRETRLIRIAENVQRAILRPLPADLGGMAFASRYHSATPGTLVGGDLYDLAMTPFGPRLIIGDVKGKGLDAVGRCAAVIAAYRTLVYDEPDLVALAMRLDEQLAAELGIEDFVTVIIAEFEADSGTVRLVNCGHPAPVKVGGAGPELIAPRSAAVPIGLQPRPVRQDVALAPGERLLFYTDGLVEARNRARQFLALDERLTDAFAAPGLDECLANVSRMLLDHAGRRLDDDVLLVACEQAMPAREETTVRSGLRAVATESRAVPQRSALDVG